MPFVHMYTLGTFLWFTVDMSHNRPLLMPVSVVQQEDDAMEGLAADDASPASAVRERYERMFKEKQRGPKPGGAAAGDPAAAALAAQGQAMKTAFRGSISSVFNKHLT